MSKSAFHKISPLPAIFLSSLLLLAGALLIVREGRAQSSQAELQAQIERYGCHLPQYANSVAGCRALHARARALRSGGGSYSASASRPRSPARYTAAPPSGGGLFGGLFGGSGSYSNASRYGSYSNPSYSSGYSGRTWSGYGGYRTLCVRTCDGYYFPISTSTSRAGISRDAKICEQSCGAPARLFYQRGIGSDVAYAVDLQGKPYSSLENAFRYRKEFVKDCRCKPEPWSEAAKEEYEKRAENAENPGQVETASRTQDPEAAGNQAQSGAQLVAPAPVYRPQQRRRRTRYRANDPALDGRWWAGSW